jgi:four helix bundle protein
MGVSPHKNLECWKLSMELVTEIYAVTLGYPSEERFGLVSQMRRAAVSVPSNIAEGAANNTKAQFSNYLSIALGSLSELDTQVEISLRLGFVDEEKALQIVSLIDRVKALTFGLKKSLI